MINVNLVFDKLIAPFKKEDKVTTKDSGFACGPVGHFLVTLYFCVKTSLQAYKFILKSPLYLLSLISYLSLA